MSGYVKLNVVEYEKDAKEDLQEIFGVAQSRLRCSVGLQDFDAL